MQKCMKDVQSKVSEDKLKGLSLICASIPVVCSIRPLMYLMPIPNRGMGRLTRSRGPQDVTRFDAHPGNLMNGKPLVVVIKGGWASH
jgi:carboxyl-terminal processing protease